MTAALGLAVRPFHLGGRAVVEVKERLLAHARAVAVAGLLAAVASVGYGLVLWAGQRFAPPPVSFVSSVVPIAAHLPMILAYSVVGAVIAARQRHNPIGWLFLGIGLASSFVPAIDFLVAAAGRQFAATPATTVFLAWLASNFHLPMTGTLVIVAFLIFPNGRPLAGRWSWAAWGAILAALLVGFGQALDPSGLRWYPTMPNPTALPPSLGGVAIGLQVAGLTLQLVSLGVAVAAMVVRYRAYSPDERRGLFWIALTVVQLALSGGLLLVVRYAVVVPPSAGEVILVVTLVAASLVPLAATDGMLRFHLFDVDLVLAHALVYVPLTGLLAGLYAASVALFQRIFIALTGDTSDMAIVFVTLVLAGTFAPLRKGLENFVERHFKPTAGAKPPDAHLRGSAAEAANAADENATGARLVSAVELRELQARLARLEQVLAQQG